MTESHERRARVHRRIDGEMSADEARAFDAECERSPELRREYESLAEIVDLVAEAGRTEFDDVRRVDTPRSSIGREPLVADVATRLRRIAVAAVCVLAVGAAVWWAIDERSRPDRDAAIRDLAAANTGDATHRDTEAAGSSADRSSTESAAAQSAATQSAAADAERDVVASLWIARATERSKAGASRDSSGVDAAGDIAGPAAPQADPLVVALPSEHDDIHIFWVYETGRGADLGSERGKETGT